MKEVIYVAYMILGLIQLNLT